MVVDRNYHKGEKVNKKAMLEMYENCSIRKVSLELTDAALALYLIKTKKYKPYICGNSEDFFIGKKYLKDVLGLDIVYMWDSETYRYNRKNICLFFFSNDEQILNEIGLMPDIVYVNLTQAIEETIKRNFYLFFWENKELLVNWIEIFEDNISKETYLEYIKSYLEGDIYEGPLFNECDKYFDISKQQIIKRIKEEAWINLGSCRGDTIFWAYQKDITFKKIYAIEADSDRVEILRKNLNKIENNEKNIVVIQIKCGKGNGCVALDDLNIEEKVCFINMDIEGDENMVIESAESVIRKDRPVLAICAYHKPDDLITIPKSILHIDKNYRFILRKYLSGTGKHYNGIHRTNELVLYAIPN